MEWEKEVTVRMRKENFHFWRVDKSLICGARSTTDLKEQSHLFGCGSKTNSQFSPTEPVTFRDTSGGQKAFFEERSGSFFSKICSLRGSVLAVTFPTNGPMCFGMLQEDVSLLQQVAQQPCRVAD